MNTRELIEIWPSFTDAERAALLQAVSTRGKNKGYLLASSPAGSAGTKYVAWQVLVSNVAPARVSLWGLISGNGSALFSELDSKVSTALFRTALNAVEPACRWNLWHLNHDRDQILENLPAVIERYGHALAARAAGQQDWVWDLIKQDKAV